MSYTNAQYSDLLRAVNQYGSVYNYGNPSFVNPYSGAAYSPASYREIISRKTAPVDPRSAFTDYDPTAGRIATGSLGYQIGSEGLVPAAKGIYSGLTQTEYAGNLAGLTAGATLYGATRDMNPYEYGTTEQIGTIASPALAGASLGGMISSGAMAGPIGAAVGLIAGMFMHKAQQKKTDQANIDAEEKFQEERTEYTEDIAKEFEEQREQYALGAEADLWGQEASKYSNQYGAYANPYGQSYYDKGGKMKLYNGGGGMEGGYEDQYVWGCMDSVAYNYNPQATMDDGSCIFREDEIKPNVENLNPDQLSDEQLDMVTEWGTTWLPSIERPPYEPPIQRLTKEKAPISEIVEEPISPRSNVFLKDKRTSTAPEDLEAYRWDLLNPYIRENVDIFDEGGVLQSESLPVDSMFNRQLFVESSFNPSAESPAGALGLSQITEKTFNDMIGWGWVPEGKEFSDLKTDTNLAVNLQERYMNDLMTREWNKGSEDVVKAKALAAYNMGPTGLVKELNKLKSQDVDIYNSLDWINQLNSETKNYVNKIMLGGNEKFEQDYTKSWKAGGKNYDQGGITNAIAEFTGNEMIVNNQAVVEAGIKENNPSKAAGPIRLAMQKGFVTPGQETHGGNPMPVDDQGFIYTKGGKLPFKVRKGAGIYDHATDQFKQDMTDEQIMAVAKKNINKWEKNNMN